MTETPFKLLAFEPMVNGEATRCVLQHYRIPYQEIDRLFGWANLRTFVHGGYGGLPVLYGNGVRLTGPVPIIRRFDSERGRPRLLPPEQPLRREIEAGWRRFIPGLSSGVVPLAYYHLLPETQAMIRSFGEPITPLGRALLPFIYPGLRTLLSTLLRLSPARIDDCRMRMEAMLDQVDRRLAHQSYMVGDQLSLADIGMVAASAPVLLPDHYAMRVPPAAELPASFAAIVAETRKRPCADYVRRIYAELGGLACHHRTWRSEK